MKTLKQLREEYDYITTQNIPEELVLEGKLSPIPSPSEMPNLLMFRRVTYRMYPNRQVVALYYSKTVDKYLSIPFGPTGNLNLSEATMYDTMEELDLNEGAKWEATKGAVKGAIRGGVKGLFVGNAVAATPGMAVGAPIGAAIGAYKGAKKAYQKAKEKENMEEDWQSVNRKDKTDGLSQAAVNAYRRENPGSKLQTAVTEKNPKGKRAARRKSFCSRMGGMKKRLTSAKTARDPDSRINKALRRWNCEESFRQRLEETRHERLDELSPIATIGANLIKNFLGSGSSDEKETSKDDDAVKHIKAPTSKSKARISTPQLTSKVSAVDASRRNTLIRKDYESARKQVAENKIADLREMINEGADTKNLLINGRSITLNSSMAKRIVEVYDSVNSKNKKIVENMLNEDLESFKKLLNFSIKA